MFFPKEIWREIKNYMLGQKYWKEKMKLNFFDPSKTYWLPDYPTLKFRDGIKTYYCDLKCYRDYYPNKFKLKKFTCYGRPYNMYKKRYEIVISNKNWYE